MTALLVEQGEPRPWVHVEPVPNPQHTTAVAVHCDRCEQADWMYIPGLKADPGWVERMVDAHNACELSLGALDPWQPGTP